MKKELTSEQETLTSPEGEGHHLLIGIHGGVGVGKSKLAELMDEKFKITIFEEKFSENPYLERFYTDPQRWSFYSQAFFLEDVFEQMEQLPEILENGSAIVDPTHWQHTEIFALTQHQMGWMSDKDYQVYLAIYEALAEGSNAPTPDIIISVHTPVETIIDRIKERGRPYELRMLKYHPDYFYQIAQRVEKWAEENPHNIPIIIVDSHRYNYVDEPMDAFRVASQIQREVFEQLGGKEDVILPESFIPGPIMDPSVGKRAKWDIPFGR